MSIDRKILSKRTELKHLKNEEARLRQELHALFQDKAKSTCPIAIGTKIEYEPGKFGQVDRIEFYIANWDELDPTAEVHWTVTGKKINKTGEFGMKEFSPVGPATHDINGTKFTHKGIGGILGI